MTRVHHRFPSEIGSARGISTDRYGTRLPCPASLELSGGLRGRPRQRRVPERHSFVFDRVIGYFRTASQQPKTKEIKQFVLFLLTLVYIRKKPMFLHRREINWIVRIGDFRDPPPHRLQYRRPWCCSL